MGRNLYHYHANIEAAVAAILRDRPAVLGPLPHCHDIEYLYDLAHQIRTRFKKLVIVGMGGATSNPMALCALASSPQVEICFIDTPDPLIYNKVIYSLDYDNTAFCIISKSGTTLETILLANAFISQYSAQSLDIKKHFYFILGEAENALGAMAQQYQCQIIQHAGISGRYATFSAITILPALVANLNVKAFVHGAEKVLNEFNTLQNNSLMAIGASNLLYTHKNNTRTNVIIAYSSALERLTYWYAQILAESLGKGGNGFTPITVLGPQAHHSQFQLYLDGPNDKFYTLFTAHNAPQDELSIFMNKSCNVMHNILINKGMHVRYFSLSILDEENLGAVMMHLIIESIILAYALEINPFDQPAVSAMKGALA